MTPGVGAPVVVFIFGTVVDTPVGEVLELNDVVVGNSRFVVTTTSFVIGSPAKLIGLRSMYSTLRTRNVEISDHSLFVILNHLL